MRRGLDAAKKPRSDPHSIRSQRQCGSGMFPVSTPETN